MTDNRDQWYALRSRQPIGPIDFQELQSLIECGVLTDFDSVRRHNESEWVRVRDVDLKAAKEECTQPSPDSEIDGPHRSGSCTHSQIDLSKGTAAISNALDDGDPHGSDSTDPERTSNAAESILLRMKTSPLGGAVGRHTRGMRGRWSASVFSAVTLIADTAGYLLGRRWFRITVVVSLIVATGIAVWQRASRYIPVEESKAIADFRELFDQIEKVPGDADASELASLQARIQRSVEKWRPRLETQAGFRQPALLDLRSVVLLLLRVAKDLPNAIDDSRLLQKIDRHLIAAAENAQRSSELSWLNPFVSWLRDLGFWAMVFVDLCILIWFARYLLTPTRKLT